METHQLTHYQKYCGALQPKKKLNDFAKQFVDTYTFLDLEPLGQLCIDRLLLAVPIMFRSISKT